MEFYNKEKLENSRIFFDKTPPNYMTAFIIFITMLVILLLIASMSISKVYVVESDGMVSSRNSYYMVSEVSGEISNLEKVEGSRVKKGDVLFTAKVKNDDSSQNSENAMYTQVRASHDGIVHYYVDAKVGYPVKDEEVFAEVSEDGEHNLVVIAKIPATDISKVKLDQDVKIQILGINTQKYGLLDGVIESINSTAESSTQNSNDLYFECKIRLTTNFLYSKTDKIEVIKSMPVVAQIVYDKETYWDWLLEMVFNIAH